MFGWKLLVKKTPVMFFLLDSLIRSEVVFYTRPFFNTTWKQCKNSTYTREYYGFERRHWKDPHRFTRRYSVVTRAVWSQCSTDFTLPPFFFSVEPVAWKFRTQVLMSWADGTARLRWIPNSLRNSRWAITKLSPVFVKRFHSKSTLCSSPWLYCK